MGLVRYVKTVEQVAKAAEASPEFLDSRVRSVRLRYESDPEIVRAVIPRPLEPASRPEVCVTLSHVAIQINPEFTFEIGSAVFGVQSRYEGVEGIYVITMPMTAEAAVIGGRETFGEPKKIADIEFRRDGDRVSSSVTRMGMTYLEFSGQVGEPASGREFTEYAYCFKAFPSCEHGKAFDYDPLLVRLEWHHAQELVAPVDGDLRLYDSPFDPVADLPVRRLVAAQYEEGKSRSAGKVLRSVPGEWLLPFLHQRYDDTSGEGIRV